MTDSAVSGAPYLFWVAGIVLAGAVLAFVALKRRTSRTPKSVTEDATERLYAAESKEPENR